MIQSAPVTGAFEYELTYSNLIPSVASAIDAFAVVLLIGVVVGLLGPPRSIVRRAKSLALLARGRSAFSAVSRFRTP